MTVEDGLNAILSGKDFKEVFSMLQDGEKTASDVEKRLDAVEQELNTLLAQIEANTASLPTDGVTAPIASQNKEEKQ